MHEVLINHLGGLSLPRKSVARLTDCPDMTLPYFFGYKTEFFSFQNNPKDLDPACKMDLDLWDCLGRVKLVL